MTVEVYVKTQGRWNANHNTCFLGNVASWVVPQNPEKLSHSPFLLAFIAEAFPDSPFPTVLTLVQIPWHNNGSNGVVLQPNALAN